MVYSSSIDSQHNITSIFSGVWNITPYIIDKTTGKETQQEPIGYSIELKSNWQTNDNYGFIYTYIGKTKKDNPISIRLQKASGFNYSYFVYISTSDISAFSEFAFLNISTVSNEVFTSSGTYVNGHFSLMVDPPVYAEIITYGANTDRINLYRLYKYQSQTKKINHWPIVPCTLMVLFWITKFIIKTFST